MLVDPETGSALALDSRFSIANDSVPAGHPDAGLAYASQMLGWPESNNHRLRTVVTESTFAEVSDRVAPSFPTLRSVDSCQTEPAGWPVSRTRPPDRVLVPLRLAHQGFQVHWGNIGRVGKARKQDLTYKCFYAQTLNGRTSKSHCPGDLGHGPACASHCLLWARGLY